MTASAVFLAIGAFIAGFGVGMWYNARTWRMFADRPRNVPSGDGYFSVERRRGPVG